MSLLKTTSVSYLGPAGTFSQMAAIQHFGNELSYVPCHSIDEVFSNVEKNRTDFGVVPVENSTEGAVNNTQDCLIETPLGIIGEVVVPIVHHLLASSGYSVDSKQDVSRIVSHKQSLAQCRGWLLKNYPAITQEEVSSNAQAALMASENPDTLAIAGTLAAETYGLQILNRAIQDKSNNSTRFLVLAADNKPSLPSPADKTSVLIYTDNKPGALFRILEPFEKLGVSLNKIETRPSKIEAWEYVFFVDFDGHIQDETIKELFSRLGRCTAEVKILGSYPKFEAKE